MEYGFSVPAVLGGTLFSCFFSHRTFHSDGDGKETTFTEEHVHANFELLYVQEGEGVRLIRNVAHTSEPGDVFLFAPFTPHAGVCRSERGERCLSLRFAVERAELSAEETEENTGLRLLRENGFYTFHADALLKSLLESLEARVQQGETLALGGMMSAILSLVFEGLIRAENAAAEALTKKNLLADPSLQRRFVIDQFFDHLVNRNSTMEELCRRVHLSPAQLNRVIREMFGMTFKQKLIEVRLAYIKDFLKFSDLSIQEIAQRNGFSDAANFSLFFKKHVGESPSRFRTREKSNR